MKRIMIVGSDEGLSQTLSDAIMAQGPYAVVRATTVREAFLLVAEQPFDLVLAPAAELPAVRRALHALQPELALAAIGTEAEAGLQSVGEEFEFGIVSAASAAEDLQRILGARGDVTNPLPADPAPAEAPSNADEETPDGATPALEPSKLSPLPESERATVATLDSIVQNDKIAGSVLTSGSSVRAFGGKLSSAQAQAIARRVSETWREDSSALLQFMQAPDQDSDLLIFTRPAPKSQLLTLAAAPDLKVVRLRRAADALAADLARLAGSAPVDAPQAQVIDTNRFHSESARSDSFALIFQPRRPLPAALQQAVRQALQDVAAAAACELRYEQVSANAVHIVTTCPGERGSGWLAHLYKQGVEEQIQTQFGVPAQLWRRGFYATESDRPLSDVEVKLFAGESD